MEHPDQKYITALLTNDPVLLEELYERYAARIKTMVLQNNGNETDAADIFQDALISIYKKAKAGSFVLTCPLDAFLYIVCKNKWLNELNKRKTHRVTFRDTDGFKNIHSDAIKLAEESAVLEERRQLLEEKLSEMGESCARLLRLSWSGKSMEEVANLLNITYGYAREKKSECMEKLVKLVQASPRFRALKW